MTDSLKDILLKRNFEQPDEITTIKNFVEKKFGEIPNIKISQNSIAISVSNSALAGALRPEIHKLEEQLGSKKRLIIRIN